MRINQIIPSSVVDGPGIRLVVFVQGCGHNCPGCHNPSTHDYNGGMYISPKELANVLLTHLKINPLITGITWSGGEPIDQCYSIGCITEIIRKARPDINFMLYTGYLFQEIKDCHVIDLLDYIVDGPFVLAKRDIGLKFRGSSNQQVYQRQGNKFVNITKLWEMKS